MQKRWKERTIHTVLALLLLPTITVSLVYAGELVRNGDFASGTGFWTPVTATLSTSEPDCDHGASNPAMSVVPDGYSGAAYQCTNLASGSDDWTLAGDLLSPTGATVVVQAQFYTLPDCVGTADRIESIQQFSYGVWSSLDNSFSYSAASGGSVSVGLNAVGGRACFDSVSLDGAGAMDVTLHSLEAIGSGPPPWLLPVAGLGLVAVAATRLWRKRLHPPES
jgi:hypothetical protein